MAKSTQKPVRHPSIRRPRAALAWVLGSLLLLVVATVFCQTLRHEFVYDSQAQVLNDSFIHERTHWAEVLTLRVLGSDVLDFNRPANLASLMADSLVWGKNPFGYHLTSLLLHLANCLLLYLLLLRLPNPTKAESALPLVAFIATLFFGLHPLNAEAVTEVAYREDLLVAFFSLAGLFWLVKSGGSLPGCVFVILCFFLAAASKETGMMTPIWLAGFVFAFRDVPLRNRWLLLGGTLIAVAGFTVARFALEPSQSVIFLSKPKQLGGSLAETLLIQIRIWAAYFRQIISPMDLCASYGPYSIRNFPFGLSLLLLLGVLLLQAFLSLKSRLAAFGMLTFWIFLLPVSNLLPMFCPMADRFLYFPLIGIALMLASILAQICLHRKGLLLLASLALLPLAAQTYSRAAVWRDSVTLWSSTLQTNPGSIEALNNLAGALLEADKAQEALDQLAKSTLALRFQGAETFAVKAVALDAVGKTAEADAAFRRAVEINPVYAKPDHLVRGLTWNRQQADKLQIIANRN